MNARPLSRDLLDEEERLLSGVESIEAHVRRQESRVRALHHYEALVEAGTANLPCDELLVEVVQRLRAVLEAGCVCVFGREGPALRVRASAGLAVPDAPLAYEALRAGRATKAGAIAVAARSGGHLLGVVEVQGDADAHLIALAADLVGRCLEREEMLAQFARGRALAEADSNFKQTLLYAVAHDVKTPLTAVTTQFQLLEKGLLSPEDQQAVLHRAIQNLKRLCLMLDDFLDMSRMAAGRLVLHARDVSVAKVAEDVRRLFLAQAEQRQIRIALEAEEVRARADDARLRQVLNNLLSNAVKYTPPGGKIRIRCLRGDPHVVIEVTDSGPGMTQEQITRLFVPFEQVLDDIAQKMGSGLGLYLSRMIVEEHGGMLEAHSPGPGRGTTFTVKLPSSAPATR